MHLRTPSSVRSARPRFGSSAGSEVLNVHVLAAAALQEEFHFDLVLLPLIEVDDRRAGAEVVPRVLPGDRIDRVRSQFAELCRPGNRLADLRAHPDLIGSTRDVHFERRHAGVLANRAFDVRGLVDVLGDDGERPRRPAGRRFGCHRAFHRRAHVGRKVGRRPDDQVEHAVQEPWEHRGSIDG